MEFREIPEPGRYPQTTVEIWDQFLVDIDYQELYDFDINETGNGAQLTLRAEIPVQRRAAAQQFLQYLQKLPHLGNGSYVADTAERYIEGVLTYADGEKTKRLRLNFSLAEIRINLARLRDTFVQKASFHYVIPYNGVKWQLRYDEESAKLTVIKVKHRGCEEVEYSAKQATQLLEFFCAFAAQLPA